MIAIHYCGKVLFPETNKTISESQFSGNYENIYIKKGFNINDSTYPFTEKILNHSKTIETRNKNTLKSLLGEYVGIIKTGKGKAVLIGFCRIADIKEYNSIKDFRKDYKKHLVKPGTSYDFPGKKYGYILNNVFSCVPEIVNSYGYVIRNL